MGPQHFGFLEPDPKKTDPDPKGKINQNQKFTSKHKLKIVNKGEINKNFIISEGFQDPDPHQSEMDPKQKCIFFFRGKNSTDKSLINADF